MQVVPQAESAGPIGAGLIADGRMVDAMHARHGQRGCQHSLQPGLQMYIGAVEDNGCEEEALQVVRAGSRRVGGPGGRW
jgi:hypothetical protein